MSDPELSLVAACRNEQYGGDFFGRARSFLRNVAWLARRQRMDIEVVLVEWSPLADRAPLAEVLAPANRPKGLRVRIVTVPKETASAHFDRADLIPLWVYAAKNVGIRRARGEFVLSTNPDVLFTPQLFRLLKGDRLSQNAFYRTDRYDAVNIPLHVGPRSQLAKCATSVVRVNLLGSSLHFEDPLGRRALRDAVREHLEQKRGEQPLTAAEKIARPTEWIHTNASGDFFLMQRDRWAELKGYPEFASAGHLDAYICVMATSAGIRQVVLEEPARLYHIEHERAVDWQHPERSAFEIVPYETFLEHASQMLQNSRPIAFNGASWGLVDVDMPETSYVW